MNSRASSIHVKLHPKYILFIQKAITAAQKLKRITLVCLSMI